MRTITITGDLGSGKSSVARLLSDRLGARIVSTGSLQRSIAAELEISTLELNHRAESDPSIDQLVDSRIKEEVSSDPFAIFDSRLAWHFIPNSFKVCLRAPYPVAAARILDDSKRTGETYPSVSEAITALQKRRNSEIRRFWNTYAIDCDASTNFDLEIDTSFNSPTQVADLILEQLEQQSEGRAEQFFWMSPCSLFPTQTIRHLGNQIASDVTASVMAKGFDSSHPIQMIVAESLYFIYDGHKRTSAAITAKLNWIPILPIARNNEPIRGDWTAINYARENCERAMIYDWEDVHKYRFATYPSWIMDEKVRNSCS